VSVQLEEERRDCTVNDASQAESELSVLIAARRHGAWTGQRHSTAPPPSSSSPAVFHHTALRTRACQSPAQWHSGIRTNRVTNPPFAPSQREIELFLGSEPQTGLAPQQQPSRRITRAHAATHLSDRIEGRNLHSLWLLLLLSRRASPAESPVSRPSLVHSSQRSRQHGQCARSFAYKLSGTALGRC
jgi:hypothetical protein